MFRNKLGFTLMEMMIVVFVISILVGVAGISASALIGQAKGAGVNADAKSLETAMLQAQVNNSDVNFIGGNFDETKITNTKFTDALATLFQDVTGATPDAAFIADFTKKALYSINPVVDGYTTKTISDKYLIIGDPEAPGLTSTDIDSDADVLAYVDQLKGLIISLDPVTDKDGNLFTGVYKFKKTEVVDLP
jgi:prepilin-type N-terminal cleavage/methylation domain-containing protein